MNKIVIALFALVAAVLAEPPVSYGAPSFSTFSSGSSGGYDDGGNDGASFVDSALLARVAQIIEQSESSSGYSSSSSGYSAPTSNYGPPSSNYGAPSRGGGGGGLGGISLGRPERAQRVAEFDLSGGSDFRSGGYSSGGYN
ncbi:hypothetical protein Ocin01_13824 [Orchesella cincta]|uniref:Uncharacterized protein n=1 Tax=Orchesella cincta TaxID=48709 RepID=A0A1D2MIM0_ORCCI|nr:hypothetical protein Ocin01_13824 [Orchesella cincta]